MVKIYQAQRSCKLDNYSILKANKDNFNIIISIIIIIIFPVSVIFLVVNLNRIDDLGGAQEKVVTSCMVNRKLSYHFSQQLNPQQLCCTFTSFTKQYMPNIKVSTWTEIVL